MHVHVRNRDVKKCPKKIRITRPRTKIGNRMENCLRLHFGNASVPARPMGNGKNKSRIKTRPKANTQRGRNNNACVLTLAFNYLFCGALLLMSLLNGGLGARLVQVHFTLLLKIATPWLCPVDGELFLCVCVRLCGFASPFKISSEV